VASYLGLLSHGNARRLKEEARLAYWLWQ